MSRYSRFAVVAAGSGGRFERIEEELPRPGRGEVLIRVHRAGVAFGDILRSRAIFAGRPRYPFTPGYDVAGEVIEAGPPAARPAGGGRPGARRPPRVFGAGDRVAAYTGTGGYTQVARVPRHRVVAIPEGIGYPEAAALVLNYLTAWQMMHRLARVREGDRVLVHSAAGGVGTALLQLGRLAGLRMYGTASAGKLSLVESLGAVAIDYRSADFVQAIRRAEPGGLDAAFEAVSIENAYRSRSLLRKGGMLVYYGFVGMAYDPRYGGRAAKLIPRLLRLRLFSGGTRTRIYAISADRRRDWFRRDMEALFRLLKAGRIQPLIHRTFPLEQAYEAHEYLLSGRASGKLLLDCSGGAA